jgi:hypothetical protein
MANKWDEEKTDTLQSDVSISILDAKTLQSLKQVIVGDKASALNLCFKKHRDTFIHLTGMWNAKVANSSS